MTLITKQKEETVIEERKITIKKGGFLWFLITVNLGITSLIGLAALVMLGLEAFNVVDVPGFDPSFLTEVNRITIGVMVGVSVFAVWTISFDWFSDAKGAVWKRLLESVGAGLVAVGLLTITTLGVIYVMTAVL